MFWGVLWLTLGMNKLARDLAPVDNLSTSWVALIRKNELMDKKQGTIEFTKADLLIGQVTNAEYAILNALEELRNPDRDIVVKVTADYFLSKAIEILKQVRHELD